jgi:threonyl-tRNA synthetase
VRAECGAAGATVARSVRDAARRKIPNVAVVGAREEADGGVALRRHGDERRSAWSVDELERRLLDAIAARSRDLPRDAPRARKGSIRAVDSRPLDVNASGTSASS